MSVQDRLDSGEWVDFEEIHNELGLEFTDCIHRYEHSYNSAWWSVVGKTEEERNREGMKVTNRFRLRKEE